MTIVNPIHGPWPWRPSELGYRYSASGTDHASDVAITGPSILALTNPYRAMILGARASGHGDHRSTGRQPTPLRGMRLPGDAVRDDADA